MSTEPQHTEPPAQPDRNGPQDHAPASEGVPTAELWDAQYAGKDQLWSGNPNDSLVQHTGDLAPGRALDLGCGEGADAIWKGGTSVAEVSDQIAAYTFR